MVAWISNIKVKYINQPLMKRIPLLLLFVVSVFTFSCQSTADKLGDFQLLPFPQQFEITGVSDLKYDDIHYYFAYEGVHLPASDEVMKSLQKAETIEKATLVLHLEESLDVKEEGYTLEITEKQILLTGKDKAGLFYGFMTLKQLMDDAKEQQVSLPICKIKDFPLLAYRAIHIDIKHHREKISYYYDLMDRLASYKVNAIIVEAEDKIKYQRQPVVGSEDALSIDEWQKLSDYAQERNIEISPLVQGLGHASFILKHDQYKDLRDDPESDWAFNPLDPKTYEVQFDLYLDAIAATPNGKYLHIGGDEVHTTGRNSGKSSMELQMIWLNKVCQFAEEQGRIPIFWDDMPLKYAGVYRAMFDPKLTKTEVDSIWTKNEHHLTEFIDQFPKNCIYMRWNYETPDTYGNLKTMDWFTANGFKVFGATAGQTRWVLMPQEGSNIENIKSFALSSIKRNLNGLLLTLWDDDSPHFELYMRGILAFAEYAWAGDKRTTMEIKSVYRQRAFGHAVADEHFAFIDQLETPVKHWRNVLVKKTANRNRITSMDNVNIDGVIEVPDPNNKGKWTENNAERLELAKEMVKVCDSISFQISEVKQKAIANAYTIEVYEQVNELVKFSFELLIALEHYDTPSEVMTDEEALKNIEMISERFKLTRSRFEEVYSKTRILTKPEHFILDQDHHRHSANQSVSFDWQFVSELAVLAKLDSIMTLE